MTRFVRESYGRTRACGYASAMLVGIGLMLSAAAAQAQQQCPVNTYEKWVHAGGGFYVGTYYPSWQQCVNNIKPQSSL